MSGDIITNRVFEFASPTKRLLATAFGQATCSARSKGGEPCRAHRVSKERFEACAVSIVARRKMSRVSMIEFTRPEKNTGSWGGLADTLAKLKAMPASMATLATRPLPVAVVEQTTSKTSKSFSVCPAFAFTCRERVKT